MCGGTDRYHGTVSPTTWHFHDLNIVCCFPSQAGCTRKPQSWLEMLSQQEEVNPYTAWTREVLNTPFSLTSVSLTSNHTYVA